MFHNKPSGLHVNSARLLLNNTQSVLSAERRDLSRVHRSIAVCSPSSCVNSRTVGSRLSHVLLCAMPTCHCHVPSAPTSLAIPLTGRVRPLGASDVDHSVDTDRRNYTLGTAASPSTPSRAATATATAAAAAASNLQVKMTTAPPVYDGDMPT